MSEEKLPSYEECLRDIFALIAFQGLTNRWHEDGILTDDTGIFAYLAADSALEARNK